MQRFHFQTRTLVAVQESRRRSGAQWKRPEVS